MKTLDLANYGPVIPVIVIGESIFAISGMGKLFFDAVLMRDFPVVMGILTIGSVLTLFGNLIADIGYAWADPRIRRGISN